MVIRKPSYYSAFRCIASACPDSCCQEWDVQVDAASAAYYRSLPGALGDRLRQVLRDEDEETVMTIENGRCPMWRQDGLCRIQAELGEKALCHVCSSFPRLRHDYGDFAELGLELSCPEAARMILSANPGPMKETLEPGGEEPEYDRGLMAELLLTRQEVLAMLELPGYSVRQKLALLLVYGYHAQEGLDWGYRPPFAPESSLETAKELAGAFDREAFFGFFRELELLTPEWKAMLEADHSLCVPEESLALARYLVQRYWLQAMSDEDLVSRVKFCVIACLLVGSLGGDYTRTAQLFSKEIENDADNVDAILDGAYTEPAFTDAALLGMVLGDSQQR